MRAVVQRCLSASVTVEGKVVGQVGPGLAVFLGVAAGDDEKIVERTVNKIAGLRIFNDGQGRFDKSVRDIGGAVLVISNFTVYGDARKGMRPNFVAAAPPAQAERLYDLFVTLLRGAGVPVETGIFAADMRVVVENDGPVTVIVEL